MAPPLNFPKTNDKGLATMLLAPNHNGGSWQLCFLKGPLFFKPRTHANPQILGLPLAAAKWPKPVAPLRLLHFFFQPLPGGFGFGTPGPNSEGPLVPPLKFSYIPFLAALWDFGLALLGPWPKSAPAPWGVPLLGPASAGRHTLSFKPPFFGPRFGDILGPGREAVWAQVFTPRLWRPPGF